MDLFEEYHRSFQVVHVSARTRGRAIHGYSSQLPARRRAFQLLQRLAQHVFIGSASCTASSQFFVHDYGRHTANAELFGTNSDLMLMHVVNVDFVFTARHLLHHFDGFFAGGASGAKDFNLVFLIHDSLSVAPS